MFSEEFSDSSACVSELPYPLQPEHLQVLGKQLQLPPSSQNYIWRLPLQIYSNLMTKTLILQGLESLVSISVCNLSFYCEEESID